MHPIPSQTAELVERWLAEQLGTPSSVRPATPTHLASETAPDLLEAVRMVLACRPALARAARRLSAYDQFRLTLELCRAAARVAAPYQQNEVKAAHTQRTCFALRRGRRRPATG